MNLQNLTGKKDKIVQASAPHTGSTVLFNLIYGFIDPLLPYGGDDISGDIIVSHNIDLDHWENLLKGYNVYFICSERPALHHTKIIDPKYHSNNMSIRFSGVSERKKLLLIQFEELNETPKLTIKDIVDNIHIKLKNFLPPYVKLNKKSALDRIINMNKLYSKIKDRPFSYHDEFYSLHGSHRNREKV